MDPPPPRTLDPQTREALRREQAEYAERLALAALVGADPGMDFEDAEHCRHFERLKEVFQELDQRRARVI